MIEELKPYSDYQCVNSRWVQRAPKHWEVKKLRALTTPRSERNRPDLPLLSVARERGVFVRTENDDNHNFVPDDLSNYKVARTGSLVINKMKAWQGSMGIAPTDGIVSPAYFIYDFRISNRMFGQALLRSGPYVAHFAQASDGVRVGQWDLSIDRMREIPVVLPPPDEQAAIVRFLDHANWRIDQFIRSKRKLIALLNEQKQAIIHRAVTRGLNQNAKLRESGDVWLGLIPEGWSIQRLWTISSPRVERNPGGLPLLSVFLDKGVIRYEEGGGQVHAPSLDLSDYQVVHPGDFVLNNQQAWRGSVGVSTHYGIISPAYIALKLSNQLDARYGNYLLRSRSMVDQLVAASKGVGDIQRQVYWPYLRRLLVPLPPLHEQHQIARSLDDDLAGVTTAIRRTSGEITLMQEYRTRLVSDVVTGQLDVRAAAASLPAVEPETPPETDGGNDIDDNEAP